MADRGAAVVYRLRGFVRGVNWKPTQFEDDASNYLICILCQVFPRSKVLLPCEHALWEYCYDQILQDGRGICPSDGETFEEDECHKIYMATRKVETLKAHCWNEFQGCDFVGSLQSVLEHYEEECRFHAVSCPRSSESVLNGDLSAHCTAGCSHAEASSPADCCPQQGGAVTPVSVPANGTNGVKTLLKHPYDDKLPALETRVNELTKQAIVHKTQLQEITVAFEGTLRTLSAELDGLLGKFSATLGEALQASQRVGASAVLEQPGVGEGGDQTSEAPVPWRKEKKGILRNWELMASGAVRSLQHIQECAVERFALRQHKHETLPSVILEELPDSATYPDCLNRTECDRFRCILTLENRYNVGHSVNRIRSATAVFRAFQSTDLCFAVSISSGVEEEWDLKLVFTWAAECEDPSLMPRVAAVKIISAYLQYGRSSLELNEKVSVALPSGRTQVFYHDGSWRMYSEKWKVQFEIEIKR